MTKLMHEVWQVVDSRNFGGIESHILQLVCGLNKMGVSVKVVFTHYYGEHPLFEQLNKGNIAYYVCQQSTLYELIKKHKPALIHTHGYKASILTRFCCLFNKTPVISTFHAGEKPQGRMWLYDLIDRYSSFLSKHRFAVSQKIKMKIPYQTDIAKNFVNTHVIDTQSIDNSDKQVAFVGRLSKEKGTDNLLKIAEALPNINFHIYGDGPEKETLIKSNVSNLILHGQQTKMDDVWSNIGLLILPSLYEGLPMVVLEAMARGIPVVASDVGDLYKVITDHKNGWLVKPGDIAAYVNTIKYCFALTDKDKQQLHINIKSTIKNNYSVDAVLPELIFNYQKVLDNTV